VEEGLDTHHPQRVGAPAQRPQRVGGGKGPLVPMTLERLKPKLRVFYSYLSFILYSVVIKV